jgi:NO-binding membrane sensor protein with MHYT domain
MRLGVWGRSILLGWAALLVIAFALENPLLHWTAPLFGASWIATAHLAFDCVTVAAGGFVTGRFNRAYPVWSAVLFAVTLCFLDFGEMLALNVPWLVRLAWNSFHDSRFLDALATSAETHVLLFGCLIAGAMLSRAKEKPVSIVD